MALVIYSSRTGRIRRILTDDNPARPDQILQHKHPTRAGESSEIIPNPPPRLRQLQRRLNKLTGKIPQNDRYVVYGTSGVVGRVFIGDPDAGDVVNNRTVKQDNRAGRRWRRNIAETSWERSLREINGDITRKTDRRDYVESPAWLAKMRRHEHTEAEIQATRTALVADLTADIVAFEAEKTIRQGPRP